MQDPEFPNGVPGAVSDTKMFREGEGTRVPDIALLGMRFPCQLLSNRPKPRWDGVFKYSASIYAGCP